MIELQLSDDALVNLAPQLARANGEYTRRILGADGADTNVEKALRQLLRIPIDQVPAVLRGAVHVSMDPERLVESIRRQRVAADYLERLLAVDAPVELIMATLGLRRREVRLQRTVQGLSPRGAKIPEVSGPDRARIIEAWRPLAALARSVHPAEPWLRLAERFDGAFSLRALHAVLVEAGVKP